jgi:hypothetical protein
MVCLIFTDFTPLAVLVLIHHNLPSLLGSDSWQAERPHSDMVG